MNIENAYQDTYYVVVHGWWMATYFVPLILVLVVSIGIWWKSQSRRAKNLGRWAFFTLLAGQLIGSSAFYTAWITLSDRPAEAMRWLPALNAATAIGMGLTLLALVLTVLAVIAATTKRGGN